MAAGLGRAYFLIFSLMKNDILGGFLYQFGQAFLNRTGTEIGYRELGFMEMGAFN